MGLGMANSGKNKMLRAHGLCGTDIYDIHNLVAAEATPRGGDDAAAAARAATLARRLSVNMSNSIVRRSAVALRAEETQMRRRAKHDVAARRHVEGAVLVVPQLAVPVGLGRRASGLGYSMHSRGAPA